MPCAAGACHATVAEAFSLADVSLSNVTPPGNPLALMDRFVELAPANGRDARTGINTSVFAPTARAPTGLMVAELLEGVVLTNTLMTTVVEVPYVSSTARIWQRYSPGMRSEERRV